MALELKTEIAERISLISVSSTMKVAADAEKLRAQGVDVVDFGAGEPDFPTPDNVKQAAVRAIEQNFTKYTGAGGTAELKQAVRAACQGLAQPTSPPSASSAWAAST
jgi:aspartate aminotransferase